MSKSIEYLPDVFVRKVTPQQAVIWNQKRIQPKIHEISLRPCRFFQPPSVRAAKQRHAKHTWTERGFHTDKPAHAKFFIMTQGKISRCAAPVRISQETVQRSGRLLGACTPPLFYYRLPADLSARSRICANFFLRFTCVCSIYLVFPNIRFSYRIYPSIFSAIALYASVWGIAQHFQRTHGQHNDIFL